MRIKSKKFNIDSRNCTKITCEAINIRVFYLELYFTDITVIICTTCIVPLVVRWLVQNDAIRGVEPVGVVWTPVRKAEILRVSFPFEHTILSCVCSAYPVVTSLIG